MLLTLAFDAAIKSRRLANQWQAQQFWVRPSPLTARCARVQARFFCNAMPWVDCTQLRFHCTKLPDVDLCPQASKPAYSQQLLHIESNAATYL